MTLEILDLVTFRHSAGYFPPFQSLYAKLTDCWLSKQSQHKVHEVALQELLIIVHGLPQHIVEIVDTFIFVISYLCINPNSRQINNSQETKLYNKW